MDGKAFLKTMIEVLNYDETFNKIDGREQLIRMLGRAKINFKPQWEFVPHGRSGQHYEVIEFRFPVPLLNEVNKLKNELNRISQYVYEESDDYALSEITICPLVLNTPEEVTEHNVVFDDIQNTVIQGIRDAKFIIWAAVAWFSNDAIYQELLAKKNNGLNIRIIVSQENANEAMIAKLKSEGFDVKVIPKWGIKGYNRMHDKFCIIDMDYVMHGSYNWTPTANNNEETLATASDHALVSKFAEMFMELYNKA